MNNNNNNNDYHHYYYYYYYYYCVVGVIPLALNSLINSIFKISISLSVQNFRYCLHSHLVFISLLFRLSSKTLLWAASFEKVPANISKMRRFRSSCACEKYHPGLCSPIKHSVVYNDSISGQWRPWPECANAQADLDLRSPHTPKDTFYMAGPLYPGTSLYLSANQLEHAWCRFSSASVKGGHLASTLNTYRSNVITSGLEDKTSKNSPCGGTYSDIQADIGSGIYKSSQVVAISHNRCIYCW